MAVINNLAATDPTTGETKTFEIQDSLHDQAAALINNDPVIELKNSITDHDQKGYNAETLSETLNSGTKNDIYTRYLAKRQITNVSANTDANGLIIETVNQTGAEQQQEIKFTGLDTASLSTRVTTLENQNNTIQTRLTTIQNTINTNTNDIATNTSGIATNKSNIATNKSNIATNKSNIATNTSDIATIKKDMVTNAANISANTNKINNIGTTLFPIGSIFTTTTDTNPGTFLGGTWSKTDAIQLIKNVLINITIGTNTTVQAQQYIENNTPDGYTFGYVSTIATVNYIGYAYMTPPNDKSGTIYTNEHTSNNGSLQVLAIYTKDITTWKRTA